MTGTWDAWLDTRARVRERRGLTRTAGPAPGAPQPSAAPIDLASNDYLGLARHPRVREAAARAAVDHGVGAGASRVVTGTHPLHVELEREVAALAGASTALVFSSGYTANLGVLGAIGGPRSAVVLDEHAHASLRDGAALSGAEVHEAPHGHLPALGEQLARLRAEDPGRRLAVVVESVYSVLGDAADLRALGDLCAEHDALLVVDEAHSLGTVPEGSCAAAAGLWRAEHPGGGTTAPVILTATLSKALGAQGGVALFGGDPTRAAAWRSHVLNTARAFLFDTALALPTAAAAAEACRLAATGEPAARLTRRRALAEQTLLRRSGLAPHVESGAGAVHAVRMPSPQAAVAAAAALAEDGVHVACFRPPSVPDGVARLRLSVHADHGEQRLRGALEQIASRAEAAWGAATGPGACPFAHGDPRPAEVRGDHLLVDAPEHVRAVLADPDAFSSANALTVARPLCGPARRVLAAARFRLPPVLASAGGEQHRHVRRVVTPFFSPAKVRAQREAIRDLAGTELDRALAVASPGEPIDLAATVAAAVPARIMSALTGVPNPDEELLHRWSADSLELFWGWPDDGRQVRLARSAADFHRWLRTRVAESAGSDDLFGALAAAGVDDERIVSLGYFLVIAGQETTRMLIATALDAALRDRATWTALAGDDEAAGLAAGEALVGETLRARSSVPTWRRVATRDTEVGGHPVAAGVELVLRLSGEDHPDHRLAFGHGLHRCLGAGLAELETALVVREVARRLPEAELTGPEPPWLTLLSFQAPRHVLVRPGSPRVRRCAGAETNTAANAERSSA